VRGIVSDANIEGHVGRLVDRIRATSWIDFWNYLGIELIMFDEIGLEESTPDNEVWRTCQREQLVLITANRNNADSDSLEATILAENTDTSLPVLTLADANRVLQSSEYAERVVARLITYLIDIDLYRGTGRLYLP
jgi:predicted nuclease of predicted toxin-antitoxin system